MTFNPAKRASPWSNTRLMTWEWRAVPKSFKASRDRMHSQGGSSASRGTQRLGGSGPGGSRRASAGRGTRRRTWSGTTPGSVRVAGHRRHRQRAGREPAGRSSSAREVAANPSSLRICATAMAELVDEDAEASWGVTNRSGGRPRHWELLHEEGA